MKRLALITALGAALGLLSACGDSTGSGLSPWIGTWDIHLANGPGWMVAPASSIVSVRDSSGHLYAVTPTIGVTDSGYTDPIGFVQAYAVQDGATASDSIALAVAGQGINTGFHYLLRLAGIRNGSSASGLITLQALGIGDAGAIGTWTATKQ